MKIKKLTPKQKAGLGWIINVYWEWLEIHINAPVNHFKLKDSHRTGEYDDVTKELLNFIRNRFNEDSTAVRDWQEYNMWRIINNK